MMYRSERPDKGTIVYVGGLVGDVKKEDLEVEFEKFGTLNRVWVAFNPPGFAFVEYDKKEDAESAVNALHNATKFGSKLRVEISRGRGRGGRGGMSGRGGGGRGGFGDDHDDFRGGDFGRGRGFGRGGFGGSRLFERDESFKPFRGSGLGGRFDDFEERRRSEFADRDFGSLRGFGSGRGYGELEPPRGFGADRDIGGRDFASRDLGGRDFPSRDIEERDFMGGRDGRNVRNFGPRDYGVEREMNGTRGYGNARDLSQGERGYTGGRDIGNSRDFLVSQATVGGRDFGSARDIAPVRDVGGGRDFGDRDVGVRRDYGAGRDIGVRRDAVVRDFNPPRDLEDPRDFGGRPSRVDYADNDRFNAGGRGGYDDVDVRRAGGFDSGRYSGGDIGGSGDYGSYGARDRFRSRSPIGRVSRPMY